MAASRSRAGCPAVCCSMVLITSCPCSTAIACEAIRSSRVAPSVHYRHLDGHGPILLSGMPVPERHARRRLAAKWTPCTVVAAPGRPACVQDRSAEGSATITMRATRQAPHDTMSRQPKNARVAGGAASRASGPDECHPASSALPGVTRRHNVSWEPGTARRKTSKPAASSAGARWRLLAWISVGGPPGERDAASASTAATSSKRTGLWHLAVRCFRIPPLRRTTLASCCGGAFIGMSSRAGRAAATFSQVALP